MAKAKIPAYRERGMPAFYLIALFGSGLFFLFLVVITILDPAPDGSFNPFGAIIWGAVLAVVVRYGLRHAYRVRIVGDTLEWDAPLRRRHLPLTALTAAQVTGQKACLTTTSGDTITVAVPSRRTARQFFGFCEAVQRRVPDFKLPTETP